MKVLGIIPARGGSKGVPGKNTKILGGKPLMAYTAEAALQSSMLSKIILSTDDPEIAKVGGSLGLTVPFLRPESLALDDSPTLPVIQHALGFYKDLGELFDAVCLLQVTSPFRAIGLIDMALKKFHQQNADSLMSVLKVPDHFNPHWTFETSHDGFLKISTGEDKIISRRQELPICFFRDGSIYITKTEVISAGSLYGNRIAFYENDPNFYINIDTLDDWAKAEKWLLEAK
jgi:CMP-N-acetylneuraminic acid synthetase